MSLSSFFGRLRKLLAALSLAITSDGLTAEWQNHPGAFNLTDEALHSCPWDNRAAFGRFGQYKLL